MKSVARTLGALTLLLAAPAFAQSTLVDSDGNGTFSMAEMRAVYPDLSEEAFAAIDADASGEVSIEELAAAQTNGLLPTME
ncbi:calcium-binding protein [Celeribacter ethanolicus]|uniref:Calcium-binding protein n=1 Tax=Celeribacter ethanolicus TaxID=1758178 RepID=A0A291GHJ4_9RHOB|nr:calcium-binding protein [Celeribacter ethanolicus]ATG49839.1 calcium-binding protein [Celeribacter ethanolicus]